ncbi:MAG: hypothetical protein LBQ27_00570, partial [Clostridiales bacterium]|nr:hypothetical protein [Clostridiales bacterium]
MAKYTLENPIRQIEGSVDIDFVGGGGADEKAEVIETSREGDLLKEHYSEILTSEIFAEEASIKKIARLGVTRDDGTTYCDSFLNGEFYLFDDRENSAHISHIGWWGDNLSAAANDGTGYRFDSEQQITVKFDEVRTVTCVKVTGDKARKEYPPMATVELYGEQDGGNEQLLAATTESIKLEEYAGKYIAFDKKTPGVKYIKLSFWYWSHPMTVAKINFFDMVDKESYEGSGVASIEVLEEKSGEPEELSYGMSSNYCKVAVKKAGDISSLNKNAEIEPYIKDGAALDKVSLGRFYADEWKIDDESVFMTCKGYDALYSLRNIYILYPREGDGTMGYTIERNKPIKEVVGKIFDLIKAEKKRQGIASKKLNARFVNFPAGAAEIKLDYVLLGEDSAWNMLQQIANYCQCYVYVDRKGNIVFERDLPIEAAGTAESTENAEDSGVRINPANAFRYNKSLLSKLVVNTVYVDYYKLVND